MTSEDQERIIRNLLGGQAMRVVIDRLDKRLGKDDRIAGSITLPNPPVETSDAITSLLGRPPHNGGDLRFKLSDLDNSIRIATSDIGLFDAITIVLKRPPSHPAQQRRRHTDQWHAMLDRMSDPTWDDPIAELVCRVIASSEMRRLSGGDILIAEGLAAKLRQCLMRLPLSEPEPLPVFALRATGDPHGMDVGCPLRKLFLLAIGEEDSGGTTDNSFAVRQRFDRVGVLLDELSSTVLCLNLRPGGESFLAWTLRAAAEAGEPIRVTFRQLRCNELHFDSEHPAVFGCENPSVMAAAAERLGPRSAGLICVEGQPSHAAHRLIRLITTAGVVMRYHGDSDPAGLMIARRLIHELGLQPWRMSEADSPIGNDAPSISIPSIVDVVYEEAVLEELLSDLSSHR